MNKQPKCSKCGHTYAKSKTNRICDHCGWRGEWPPKLEIKGK